MFDTNGYVNELSFASDDEYVQQAKDQVKFSETLLDDAYLARAHHWGVAAAMENQISYLGGQLLPKAERRLNNLANPRGVLAESDLRISFVSNEDQRHINEDTTIEDDIMEAEQFIDQVKGKMERAAVLYAIFVHAHDELSYTLEQMTYRQIKQKAEANRARRSA